MLPRPGHGVEWYAQDDRVMGGRSVSAMHADEAAGLYIWSFKGTVTTESNGGFASVRTGTFTPPLDLSRARGFRLEARAVKAGPRGRRYKFALQTSGSYRGVNYDAHFDVGADWQTFDVAFSAFEATWRSRPVTADKLDPAAVTALQFYQSKFDTGGVNPLFEEGAFELQVKAIEALH